MQRLLIETATLKALTMRRLGPGGDPALLLRLSASLRADLAALGLRAGVADAGETLDDVLKGLRADE
jgi:hypothetical protein